MRVTSDAFSSGLMYQLNSLSGKQSRLQNQVSTGQRITNPSDDPAAVGRVLQGQAEQSRLQQYNSNINRATDLSQSSYAGVSQMKDLSDRAGEIATLAGDTTSPDSLKAYAKEVNQMLEQALQEGNTKAGGDYLFSGVSTDTAPFAATRDASGNITGVSYQGAAQGASIEVGDGAQVSPQTSGADNQGLGQFMNTLVKLRDALNSGATGAAASVRADLSSSEDNILNTLSNLGATQTRLEAATSANTSRFDSLSSTISKDASADIAQTAVQLTQTQTAYQAALQTGAKIMQQSLLDYVK